MPASLTAEPSAKTSPRYSQLLALSLAMLLPSLGTSIANVALPALHVSFGGPMQGVQWVVIAYLVSVAALLVTAGRLGDLLGKRPVLLGGMALFTAASAAAAFAPELWILIVARGVQGIGAAAMMSLTLAAVGDLVPAERRGSAIGLLGTVSAVGTALGPSLGGLLVATLGWPSLFLLMAALGLIALVLANRLLPADVPVAPQKVRFDILGTLLLAGSVAAFALAATIAPATSLNLLLGAGASAGLLAFILVERRAKAPLVHLGLLAEAGMATGLLSVGLVSAILMTTLVVGPFYLSNVLTLDPAATGLVMTIGPAVAALVGIPAGRLVDRMGTAATTSAGLAGVLLGALMMAWLPQSWGLPGYVVGLVIITSSYGLFQAANGTSLMTIAGDQRRGVTSALLSLARSLGLVTGASAMGSLFALGSSGVLGMAPGGEAGLLLSFLGAAALATIALLIGFSSRRTKA